MSAVVEQEPGLPDQEREGDGMGHDARQIVLHVLPIEEAADDIDGTAAFLVSQAVVRAITEEECGQEEIWPDVEEIWPQVEEVWPSFGDIWPEIEEVWPDVEEDWYVWNSDQEIDEDQRKDQDQQGHPSEVKEEDDDDEDDDDDDEDDDYVYKEDKEENEGEDNNENHGDEIILRACEFSYVGIEDKGSYG
ncbi:calsequestrin-1-like [Grammomys surdaster]|uniref:calsequestrin-1-like n=1 Tax=Grammomys surdaster TaxID=491861 RepID=UPI0010A04A92|nr:calsequestrin-1-like [Grammomys surdaster]